MTARGRLDEVRRSLVSARDELRAQLAREKSRRRGALNRDLHHVLRMLDPDDPHVSQAGQDRVLDRVLGGKTGGVFVDIGAYDGRTGSNTLFFERERGWTGLLVEPVPDMATRAAACRAAPCRTLAIADRDGTAPFITVTSGYTQMSGLSGSYDSDLLTRVRADARHSEQGTEVPTRTLDSLLREAALGPIDYVSLDIEGAELSALSVFSFAAFDIRAWSIENNAASPAIPALMRENGYDLIDFCGQDEIYLRRAS